MGRKSEEVTGITLDYISGVWLKDYCKAVTGEHSYVTAQAQDRHPRKSVHNLVTFSQHSASTSRSKVALRPKASALHLPLVSHKPLPFQSVGEH